MRILLKRLAGPGSRPDQMKMRRLGSRRAVAVLPGSGLLILLAAACSSGAARDAATPHSRATGPASDPSLLVPWSRVGDISLGGAQARVEREYGSPGHGYHLVVRITNGLQGYYVLHGTEVAVKFRGGRVERIDFSTRYYRTKSGFGVGNRIPFGPCVRTFTHRCGHRWHGFVWNEFYKETPCGCWMKVGRGERSRSPGPGPWTLIWVRHGRVTGFTFSTTFVG
jgi:hypothetical protein